jgi:hypothetical protein
LGPSKHRKLKLEEVMNIKKALLRTTMIVATGMVAFVGTAMAQANTVQVGGCRSNLANYPTIQAAVNAAPAGGTVDVCPGTYPEQVAIAQQLTIIGITSGTNDAAVIVPPTSGMVQSGTDINGNPVYAQIFVSNVPAGVTLSHLIVDGTGNNVAGCGNLLEGIYYQDASGVITDDVVRNQYQTDFTDFGGCQNGLAINVESNNSSPAITISNNYVSSYQKNGITASGPSTASFGPSVTIQGNYVVGLAATAMNWIPNAPAGENGIQVGFGASGKIASNNVIDDIWESDTSSDTGDAASGILVYASTGITVSGNIVGSTQFGIAIVTGSTLADGAVVTGNKVFGTQLFDAIDLCSNGDEAQGNFLYGNAESGVHADSTCGSTGTGATIKGNVISGSCAGVLNGGGGAVGSNTYLNDTHTVLSGNSCPVSAGGTAIKQAASAQKSQSRPRPSPFIPGGKK